MDRKSIFVVVLCLALLVGMNFLINKLYPPIPVPRGATNAVPTSVTQPATATTSSGTVVVTSAEAPVSATNAVRFNSDTNTPEKLVVITNDNARYTFTSHGGGLRMVELLHYPETVRRKK